MSNSNKPNSSMEALDLLLKKADMQVAEPTETDDRRSGDIYTEELVKYADDHDWTLSAVEGVEHDEYDEVRKFIFLRSHHTLEVTYDMETATFLEANLHQAVYNISHVLSAFKALGIKK